MGNSITFHVGVDEHKDSLVAAVVSSKELGCRPAVRFTPSKLLKLLTELSKQGEVRVVYEAGPGGFALQRRLESKGFDCRVAAPSLIPKISGKRQKTDKIDAVHLALSYRAGQLTFCRVPTADQEKTRALVRCREDISEDVRRTRLRILSFVRTLGLSTRAKNWTIAHRGWLKALDLEGELREVLAEYLAKLDYEESRLKSLDQRINEIAKGPIYAKAVSHLCCLKGISTLSAMVLLTEIGDFNRFSSPRQLMAFFGLVPAEHSSGQTRRLGHITKTGNGRCRRILVEAAYHARHKPAPSSPVSRRRIGQPPGIVAIATKAATRLNKRYWHLAEKKTVKVAAVAIARELSGFIWAIMTHSNNESHSNELIGSAAQR